VTFAARMHQPAGGGSFTPLGALLVQLESINEVGTTATGTLSFNSDGTISLTENYEYQVVTLPSNWYSPTTTDIGSGYQIRFTLLSGSAWDAGLVSGTLYALSSNRSIAWTRVYDSDSNPETASVLIEILTSAGEPYKSGTLAAEMFNGPE
jgi:hypothetical protein